MANIFSKLNTDFWIKLSRWQEYLLIFFMAGLYFTIIAVEMAAAVYLLLFLMMVLSGNARIRDVSSYLILLYILLGLLGYSRSGTPNLLTHLVLISFLPISVWLEKKTSQELLKWLRLIALFASATAIMGMINHILGKERTSGTFGGYFTLATLMTWGIPVTATLFFTERNKFRGVYLLSVFIQVMALWWTYTRSAILGLFLGFAAWGIFRAFHLRRLSRVEVQTQTVQWVLVAVPLLILVILILTSSDPRMNPLAPAASSPDQTVDLSSGRSQILEDARGMITEDWREGNYLPLVLGYGLSSRENRIGGPFTSWESDYLQALMDHGLLGLVVIIAIYLLYSRLILRGLRHRNYGLNGLAVVGIITLVMSFLTLRLTGWHSAGVFVVNYCLLKWGLETMANSE